MRLVVQRVSRASVHVDAVLVGEIAHGLLVFLGIAKGDTIADADYLVDKLIHLRIFPDENKHMNKSLLDTGGSILVVSQFTLYGDVSRGRRPSFDHAAPPDQAEPLYDYFLTAVRSRNVPVASGRFQASMRVELVNEGPVTILCESRN